MRRSSLLAVAGSAVLLASVVGSTVRAALPADTGAVAYMRVRGDAEGSAWIAVADFSGQGRHEITKRPAKNAWDDDGAVWSPDGSRLAFVRTWNDSRSYLYVANRDGTGLRRVLRVPYDYEYDTSYVSWSPNGQRLAFANGPLYLLNPDGTNSRKLVASSACKPSWSPDGKSLVYLVDDSCGGRGSNEWDPGHRAISRIDVDGSGRRVLARGSFGDASWSPDGRLIAYTDRCAVAHGGDWGCSISLMKADGNGKQRLVARGNGTWGGGDWGVAWAAGGREVLAPRFPNIQATIVATRETHMLLPGAYEGSLAGISASGQTISVMRGSTSYETRYSHALLVLSPRGRLLQRITVPRGWGFVDASVYLP
jgi:dipeptidyl aminopeptidase/acylaminoacyl peptidase